MILTTGPQTSKRADLQQRLRQGARRAAPRRTHGPTASSRASSVPAAAALCVNRGRGSVRVRAGRRLRGPGRSTHISFIHFQ